MNNYATQSPEQLLATIALHGSTSKQANQAFTAFCSKYQNRVIEICERNCRRYHVPLPEEEAKDISQAVLMKIFSNAHKFNPAAGKLSNWIWTIVLNTMFDHLRKARKLKLESTSTIEQQLQAVAESTQESELQSFDDLELDVQDTCVDEHECGVRQDPNLQNVMSAMEMLPEVQEDILRTTLLHAPNDMPSEERERIATRYNIADSTIDVYRLRAREKMEKKFGVLINWDSLKESISEITDAD